MLTFAQFLTEVFLKGIDANYGYCEIYKNPTPVEYTQAGEKQDALWALHEPCGMKCYYMGGILTPNDLFIFTRETGEHGDAAREIPNLEKRWLSLYIYYFAGNKIALSISGYGQVTKSDMNNLRHCKTHPAFKNYTLYGINGELL